MNAVIALLAVLSVWDYPARQPRHDALRRQFVAAVREGDTAAMEETSRRGHKHGAVMDFDRFMFDSGCSGAVTLSPPKFKR